MTVENINITVKTNADKAATKINALTVALERLENTAHSAQHANTTVANAMQTTASSASRAGTATKTAAKGIGDVAQSAKKAQSPLGSFVASLKRIAFYRMLRTILKEIAQAFKEGLENVYEWSKAGGDMGRIAGTLDRIASAGQRLKNQLGAAFGELLVALEPILLLLIELLTKLAEGLTRVIGLLTGEAPIANEVSKSWKEATKSAKEYKNTILGFDEINRLNDDGDDKADVAGTYSFEPINYELGDIWDKNFEWLSKFNDEIDKTRGNLGDLVAEMVAIPDAEIDLIFNDKATEPLQGAIRTVKAGSPYVVNLELAILGNPIPLIQSIRSAIMELLSGSPYVVKVKSEIANPVPQIQTITQGVRQEATAQQSIFQKAFSAIAQFVSSLSESYAKNIDNIQVENSTLGQDVQDTYNRLKNPLDGWISHMWQKVGEYQQAGSALQVENETLAGDMSDTFDAIKRSFSKFKNETLPGWATWASSVAESARLAFVNVAQNVYGGLKNAAENVAIWVKGTAQGFAEWAKSNIQAFVGWAKNVLNVIGNALSSAWSAIKSFFNGETDIRPKTSSEVFNQLFDFTGDIRGGTIPMIPYSSGVTFTMPIPAFASGGFPTPGDLFIANERGSELVGTMNGKPAVANNQEIVNGIAAGNVDVVNAVYAIGNMIVAAVREIDTEVTLDGENLANKMYKYNQAAARRYGAAFVE